MSLYIVAAVVTLTARGEGGLDGVEGGGGVSWDGGNSE